MARSPGQLTEQAADEEHPMQDLGEWLKAQRDRARTSPKTSAVLDLVGTNPRLASYASVAELAERAGVNTATVVRAAQSLGFAGWLDFRAEVRSRYLLSLSAPEVGAEHARGTERPAVASVQQDVANLAQLSHSLDADRVDEFAAAIATADRTTVVSTGSYTALAAPLAHLATVMGYPVASETRGGTHLANVIGQLDERSCLVAISFWRLHLETFRATRAARAKGATVCVLTDRLSSPLVDLASCALIVPSESASWFPSMTAGVSAVTAVLTSLERQGGQRVQDAIAAMDTLWHELELYHRT
jgi:DNA-binding MurR/RpiR family transcriptional regulator